MRDLDRLRVEYETAGLEPADLPADPMVGFSDWLAAAVDAGIAEPNICHLATVDPDGSPSVRAVLIKGVDVGLVFFTNYRSRKGRALAADARSAINVLWQPLHRQVRFEGRSTPVTPVESDEYFRSRPVEARRGAAASPQSEVIPDRAWLEDRLRRADPDRRPEDWGGYRLVPSSVEFWQGREGRLHDRVRFVRDGAGWRKERLAP